MRRSVPLLTCCLLLAACGQTGALYLPDEGVTTPVEVRPAPGTATDKSAPEEPSVDESGQAPTADKPPGRGA